jgi:hypothetical protein
MFPSGQNVNGPKRKTAIVPTGKSLRRDVRLRELGTTAVSKFSIPHFSFPD